MPELQSLYPYLTILAFIAIALIAFKLIIPYYHRKLVDRVIEADEARKLYITMNPEKIKAFIENKNKQKILSAKDLEDIVAVDYEIAKRELKRNIQSKGNEVRANGDLTCLVTTIILRRSDFMRIQDSEQQGRYLLALYGLFIKLGWYITNMTANTDTVVLDMTTDNNSFPPTLKLTETAEQRIKNDC